MPNASHRDGGAVSIARCQSDGVVIGLRVGDVPQEQDAPDPHDAGLALALAVEAEVVAGHGRLVRAGRSEPVHENATM